MKDYISSLKESVQFTDNELCMLEQICYLDSNVAKEAGIKFTINEKCENHTLREILDSFDDTALEKLANSECEQIKGAYASGKEWAAIIKYIKNNDKMGDLVLTNIMPGKTKGKNLALCFNHPNSDEAIVAFKGTSGEKEWEDNGLGLATTDTRCQLDALEFVNKIDDDYNSLTVIGHSKGGNKAMYCAINNEKINRCVSFDGQGFSKEFMEKYSLEISERADLITNYSISSDYVHALLTQIPNTIQKYCEGSEMNTFQQHHSPNSFFRLDENGNIVTNDEGVPYINDTLKEESKISIFNDFTEYIMGMTEGDERDRIAACIAEILGETLSGKKDGDVKKAIAADPEASMWVLAYLFKYIDTYEVGTDDIVELLKIFGFEGIIEVLLSIPIISGAVDDIFGNFIDFLLSSDNDPLFDKILEVIFKKFNIGNLDSDFLQEELREKMRNIESKEKSIASSMSSSKGVSIKEAIRKYIDKQYRFKEYKAVIRDFSTEMYEKLMNCLNKVQERNDNFTDICKNYYDEEWYTSLSVSLKAKILDRYYSNIDEKNTVCKNKIDKIFCEIDKIDTKYKAKLEESIEDMRSLKENISNNTHIYTIDSPVLPVGYVINANDTKNKKNILRGIFNKK